MRMFCAALSRDGSLGSLSPDRNLGVSPPSKLDKLRCEPIFVIKHLEIQDLVYVYNLSRCAGYSAEFLDRVSRDNGVTDNQGPGIILAIIPLHVFV